MGVVGSLNTVVGDDVVAPDVNIVKYSVLEKESKKSIASDLVEWR